MKTLILILSLLLTAKAFATGDYTTHLLADMNQTIPLTEEGKSTVYQLAQLLNKDTAYEVDVRCSSTNKTAPGYDKKIVGIHNLSDLNPSKGKNNLDERAYASVLILSGTNIGQINEGNLLNAKVIRKTPTTLTLSLPYTAESKLGCRETDEIVFHFEDISARKTVHLTHEQYTDLKNMKEFPNGKNTFKTPIGAAKN